MSRDDFVCSSRNDCTLRPCKEKLEPRRIIRCCPFAVEQMITHIKLRDCPVKVDEDLQPHLNPFSCNRPASRTLTDSRRLYSVREPLWSSRRDWYARAFWAQPSEPPHSFRTPFPRTRTFVFFASTSHQLKRPRDREELQQPRGASFARDSYGK